MMVVVVVAAVVVLLVQLVSWVQRGRRLLAVGRR